ncbi:MAG: hypothetical protein ABI795_07980 [Chthoniobacterales bacterium]
MKFLKAILVMAIAAGALSLGACAHRQEAMSSTASTNASTHGYSK